MRMQPSSMFETASGTAVAAACWIVCRSIASDEPEWRAHGLGQRDGSGTPLVGQLHLSSAAASLVDSRLACCELQLELGVAAVQEDGGGERYSVRQECIGRPLRAALRMLDAHLQDSACAL
jgi:hypothetical protein